MVTELSGILLRALRQQAEAAVGELIQGTVITVPANFDDAQRRATQDAAKIAGLIPCKIVNEPTAAALAYGADRQDPRRIAVFDLGGGTFDFTVLQASGQIFEVLASAGDPYLGGDDFDRLLADELSRQYTFKFNADPREDATGKSRLRVAATGVKHQLSKAPEVKGQMNRLHQDQRLPFNYHVTRDAFNQLIAPLLQKALKVCDAALREADLSATQLDEVVLVGGQAVFLWFHEWSPPTSAGSQRTAWIQTRSSG